MRPSVTTKVQITAGKHVVPAVYVGVTVYKGNAKHHSASEAVFFKLIGNRSTRAKIVSVVKGHGKSGFVAFIVWGYKRSINLLRCVINDITVCFCLILRSVGNVVRGYGLILIATTACGGCGGGGLRCFRSA